MYEIDSKLKQRQKDGNPIMVGLIGAGQMGTEIVTQIGLMDGMEIGVIVDLTKKGASAGYDYVADAPQIFETDDIGKAEKALTSSKRIATSNYLIATRLPQIDVIIDATGSVEMGAITTLDAIDHKKNIVMMSVECDITIGPILRKMADNAGVVYSLAAGDEPAAIIELYRFANALGFTIVSAGKGKNNPLNIYATPKDLQDTADERKMSSRMLCEFVDGSKTAIEMAAVSNATGLLPDIRGMHGAKSSVAELNKIFIPKKDGGILDKIGVVDFAIGVSPGVFVVIYTDNNRIHEGMAQRDMGKGPYYLLFRPYHLCSVEVPLTVAQTVIYGESSGHPAGGLVSECIAISKRPLKKGQVLDNIGETCYRGSIELAHIAISENLLPLGLAKGAVLTRDISIDEVITYDMIEIINDSVLLNLRKIQDKTII
ncbi:MAG: SAF domain-containing protein [Candidatus Humimicrobiaceae bacterium]